MISSQCMLAVRKFYKPIFIGLIIFGILIILTLFVTANPFTPQGNINLRSVYNISNAVYIFADYFNGTFIGDGSQITNFSLYNLTYQNFAYNQSDGSYNITYEIWSYNQTGDWAYNMSDGSYNSTYENYVILNSTNTSLYWDNMNTINTTQMEDNNGVLTILVSWFETLFDSLFGAKDTDDLTEGSVNFYDNQTWNQTLADSLYAFAGAGNASWNESHANTLYSDIQWGYNMSDGSYNSTYNTWAYNQSVPYDDFNYNMSDGSYNSTYDAKVSFPGYDNIAMTNITETFTKDVIFNEYVNFSNGGYMYDNGTALILGHT